MNILIIKTGALGDVVRCSFLAQALKDKYKKRNPKIFWITSKKAKFLFVNNFYIYSVISDKNKFKKINFDIIINLEEDKENCRFVSRLKYKKLIGVFLNTKGQIDYTQETKYWFDMSKISKLGKKRADFLKKENTKSHRQIIAELMGLKNFKKYEPFMRLTKKQRKFAQDFLRRYNLSKSDLIIGINTGSADRWPKSLSVKKTVQLIDELYRKFQAKILLFGGLNEIERNKEILNLVQVPVIDTGCGNDLLEFPALISACNLFITSDSLGLHIALALKRKVICLVGPTSSSELGMYGRGEKVISNSKCVCCYKSDCKSMEKINIKEILSPIKKLLIPKVTLLITAYKEPKISKAIESALNQKTRYDYEIVISVPDKETLNIVEKYAQKHKKIKIFKDPGKGKSYALNLIFPKIKTDILILIDGDVYISKNSVEDIVNSFLDPEIGCVSGRPIPQETRKNKYGYWANFLFDAAHKIRKKASESNAFIECSGYLFAFRKENINKIPVDVAEDTVIPHIFWARGYKIGYVESAKVYIKNAGNLKDWIHQKIRTHKSHGKLGEYVDIQTTPKVKSFRIESKGIFWLMKYPTNLKEILWTIELALARFYTWAKFCLDTYIYNRHYNDGWARIESTK